MLATSKQSCCHTRYMLNFQSSLPLPNMYRKRVEREALELVVVGEEDKRQLLEAEHVGLKMEESPLQEEFL